MEMYTTANAIPKMEKEILEIKKSLDDKNGGDKTVE